jgi:hypothetical protein
MNAIRDEVRRAVGALRALDLGTVASVDWQRQAAKVRLAASGQLVGPLRIGAPAAFDQGAAVGPLKAGDEVLCAFPDGRPSEAGVIICRLFGARPVPDVPAQAFGLAQGQKRVLFDAQGRVACTVAEFAVTAEGNASLDGAVVVLGQGVMAATKYEALAVPLMAWIGTVTAALAALGIVTPLPDLSGARAEKTRVG